MKSLHDTSIVRLDVKKEDVKTLIMERVISERLQKKVFREVLYF